MKEYPKEWADGADEIMEENDQFGEWFNEHFDVGLDKMIHKDAFDAMVKGLNKKDMKVKDELARMKIPYNYDSQKQISKKMESGGNAKKMKGFWTGFMIKEKNMWGEYIDEEGKG